MKIIGFTYATGQRRMVVKGDSALLNQRKPFFIPDWSKDIRMTPAKVVRICRLGKNIQPKFADRYYDAIADAADLIAWDHADADWARATSFDGALVVGEWEMKGEKSDAIDEAISEASRAMTIRMGDMIFLDEDMAPTPLKREDIIERGTLYCKIK